MNKISVKHLFLYIIAIVLFVFGNSSFLQKIKAEREKEKEEQKTKAYIENISSKEFEVQPLVFDSINQKWKNESTYFQTMYLGKVDFKNTPKIKRSVVETNDDENASESA